MSKRSRSPWSSRHIRCTGSYMLLLHPCTYTRRDIVQLTAKYVAWLYVVLSIPHFLVLSKKRQVSVGIQTCCVYDDVTRLVKEITCHDGLLSLEMHLKASVHLRAYLRRAAFSSSCSRCCNAWSCPWIVRSCSSASRLVWVASPVLQSMSYLW